MADNFSLEIGGVEYISYARIESLTPVDSIEDRSDTMQGVVLDIDLGVDGLPVIALPLEGQQVQFQYNSEDEFTGFILSTIEQRFPNHYRCTLNCADYTFWFDRHLVVEEYDAQSAKLIIQDMVTQFTEGFTTDNVEADITIAAQRFEYIRPSAVLDQLGALLSHVWYIDFDRDLHFVPQESVDAPITTIDLDSATDQGVGNVQIEYSIDQLVNRVHVKDSRTKSTSRFTEATRTGDGAQVFYALAYDPSGLEDVEVTVAAGTPSEKTYNTASGNLKLDLVDNDPGTASSGDFCYVCLDNRGIRFDAGYPPTGAVGTNYKFLNDRVITVEDPDSIEFVKAREQPPSDGVYEDVISAPDLYNVTEDSVKAFGDLVLFRQADIRTKGSFEVYGAGWRAGQSFTLTSTTRHGGFTTRMIILEVKKEVKKNDQLLNFVTFSASLWGE